MRSKRLRRVGPSIAVALPQRASLFRWTPRVHAIALALFFLIGTVVRLAHVADVKSRTPDEQYYTYLADELLDRGITPLQQPAKLAYTALLAGAMKVAGVEDERAGAWLSCFASIASLAILGLISFRFLPRAAAIYAMFAMALSTLDRVVARRSWQEAIVESMVLMLVWAACEMMRDRRRWWVYVLLLLAGAGSVLIKQITAFAVAATLLYVIAFFAYRRAWRPAALIGAAAAIAAALSIVCLAAFGSGIQVSALWRSYTTTAATESWGNMYQSAPWYVVFGALSMLAPVSSVLSFIALGISLLSRKWLNRAGLSFRSEDMSLIRLFSWVTFVAFLGIAALPMTQNFRYFAPAFGAFCLCAGMGFQALAYLAERYLRGLAHSALAIVAIVVLARAYKDNAVFNEAFVKADMQDLAVGFVLKTSYIMSLWNGEIPSSQGPTRTSSGPAPVKSGVARSRYRTVTGSVDVAGDGTGAATLPQGGTLYVGGWAADTVDGAPVQTVTVFVDGASKGEAVLGSVRSDVARAYKRGDFAASGWTFEMPAAGLSRGSHMITATGAGPSGTAPLGPGKSIAIRSGGDAVVGYVDVIGTMVEGEGFCVNGWAGDTAAGAPVQAVTVLIDGHAKGNATLGGPRPDVAAAFGRPDFANSGWTFCTRTQGFDPGTHTIRGVATGASGTAQLGPPRTISINASSRRTR